MAQQRTLVDKVADVKSTYQQFAEMLTSPGVRETLDKMTNAGQQAAAKGDPAAYVASVQASINLQRVVSANDRAALIAAVAAVAGTRPVYTEGEE